MKYTTRLLPERDIQKIVYLSRGWGPRNRQFGQLKKKYKKWPTLFIGCYKGKDLIGFAQGRFRYNKIELGSILVLEKYERKGLGGKMLKLFEMEAKKLGRKTIELGSAENRENFYLKNGYNPTLFLIITERKNLPKNYKKLGYKTKERRYGNTVKIVFIVDKYSVKFKNKIKKYFNGYKSCFYIFEKELK